MRDEGVTKYECDFRRTAAPHQTLITEINPIRNQLFAQGLIGVYPDGIGYGNVSLRLKDSRAKFIITGTQTGHKPALESADYSLVTGYDIKKNRVECEGHIAASSESMTHAAVYELARDIGAVIHVHSRTLWQRGADFYPATEPTVPYGTPQMAYEMRRLYDHTSLAKEKILIMLGHEEGVLAFGQSLAQAMDTLQTALTRLNE